MFDSVILHKSRISRVIYTFDRRTNCYILTLTIAYKVYNPRIRDRAAEIVQTLSTNSIAQVNILSRLTDRDWEKMGVNIGERIALQVALETQAPDL